MRVASESGPVTVALPRQCHVVIPGLPAGCNVAICIRGRPGVTLTTLNFGETRAARAAVRAMNRAVGVSAVAEHAMLAGAMLAWHCVLADPHYLSLYDGRFASEPRGARQRRVLH